MTDKSFPRKFFLIVFKSQNLHIYIFIEFNDKSFYRYHSAKKKQKGNSCKLNNEPCESFD